MFVCVCVPTLQVRVGRRRSRAAIMVALSLKISVGNVVKTMQFEPSTMVYDACRVIRERVPEAQLGQRESQPVVTLNVYRGCVSSF